MPTTRAIFDASLVLRAVIAGSHEARAWIGRAEANTVHAIAPDLLFAECAHALLRYVRTSALARAAAVERLQVVTALRLDIRPLAPLAATALALAAEHGISAYDACYLGLARAEEAVLVTADRRLAAAASSAELVE